MSVSVNNSNSTSAFFKHASHPNPGTEKNELNQAHIFQYIYYENFQIHLQEIMCYFEWIDHNKSLDFLF